MNDSLAKPITIIALLQAGTILAGIMAAGVCRKLLRERMGSADMDLSTVNSAAAFLYSHGFLLLAIPLVWAMLTLCIRNTGGSPAWAKTGAFFVGFVILGGLVVWIIRTTMLMIMESVSPSTLM